MGVTPNIKMIESSSSEAVNNPNLDDIEPEKTDE